MIQLEKAMAHYGISPIKFSPVTSNAYYVSNGKQDYFLKKSSLKSQSLIYWENVFHQAYRLNLPGVMPVYLTASEQLYCIVDDDIFYLTPWKEVNHHELNLELFYHYLGKIHHLTKYHQAIEPEQIEESFKRYLTTIDDSQQVLLGAVEQFEKNKYMSPFELMICTQYISLMKVFNTLKTFTQKFIDHCQELSQWSVSLCHLQLGRDHILQSDTLVIVNWEKAAYRHPIYDLCVFFRSMASSYNESVDALKKGFNFYMEENELSMTELYLLIIHLLDGEKYMSFLLAYLKRNNQTSYSMIEEIVYLNQAHRELMFGLEMAEIVENKETEMLLDDLES